MKYDKDLSFPKGWRGRAGEPGFPAKNEIHCIFWYTLEKVMDKPPIKKNRRKRCRGGQPYCKNWANGYKDVDDVGCCEQCDKYIDDNPYDPYWEQMEDAFSNSELYKSVKKNGLEYEKAFEAFQESYEPWPLMRRRMALKEKEKKTKS
jgi:hypothetical protein